MNRMLILAVTLTIPAAAFGAELKPVDDSALEAELARPGAVFVEISQVYCGPCRAAAAALHDLIPSRPDVRFLTVDGARSSRFGDLATPTFILYRDGREITRETGFHGPDQLRYLLGRFPRARSSSKAAELAAKFPGMTADASGPILAKLERDGYLQHYSIGHPPVTIDRDPVAILETADGPPLLYAPAGVTADGRTLPEAFYKLVDDGQARSMEVRPLALLSDGSAYTATGSYRARKAGAPIAAPVQLSDPWAQTQARAQPPSAPAARAPETRPEVRDLMSARLDPRLQLRFWHDPRTGGTYEVTDPPKVADTRPWRVRRQAMRPDVPADYGVTADGKPVLRVDAKTWVRIPDAQALYLTPAGLLKDKKGKVLGRFTPGSPDSGNRLFRGWGTIQGEDGRQYFYYSSGDMEDMETGTARETLIVKGEPPAV